MGFNSAFKGLNPFVQLKLMQYLNMNYFERREIFLHFSTKKVFVVTYKHLLHEIRSKEKLPITIVCNKMPRNFCSS